MNDEYMWEGGEGRDEGGSSQSFHSTHHLLFTPTTFKKQNTFLVLVLISFSQLSLLCMAFSLDHKEWNHNEN